MRIQHNIPAMNSYRNYSSNVSAVAKNLEKLSTGFKINRAGDDAAGLAISEKMRIQITGLEKAQDNAKSGINLVQTAEGALTEVHDMLNRMYDLAEQSANGTFDDDTDRKQLQKEVNSLRTEIDRIADSTNYNGIKLLDGTMSSNGKVDNFKNLGNDADGNAILRSVRDGSQEKIAANGKYELSFAGATWKASAAAGGQVQIDFGGLTVTATLNASETLTGDEVARAIAGFINADAASQANFALGNITVADAGGAINTDGNFNINGKVLNASANNGVLTFVGVDDTEFDTTGGAVDTNVNVSGGIANVHDEDTGGNQAWSLGWSELERAVNASSTLMAQGVVDLNALTIKDGTTLKIGDTTYTIAVGKESKFKDAENVVDMTNHESISSGEADKYIELASKISGAANGNRYVLVETGTGAAAANAPTGGGATPGPGMLLLTERVGGPARDEYDLIGANYDGTSGNGTEIDASWKSADGQGLVQIGQAAVNGSALTLQIGDTAESFNQLKVSVRDMHVDALGLGDIDISLQGNAQKAMNAIKAATNMVSDVRGGLGAIQNRLDHTINNLSVAQENIQDAESNIRDVDVAKEMMKYTKNNILVQSAQAMLAQANQLPQGVLQLLG